MPLPSCFAPKKSRPCSGPTRIISYDLLSVLLSKRDVRSWSPFSYGIRGLFFFCVCSADKFFSSRPPFPSLFMRRSHCKSIVVIILRGRKSVKMASNESAENPQIQTIFFLWTVVRLPPKKGILCYNKTICSWGILCAFDTFIHKCEQVVDKESKKVRICDDFSFARQFSLWITRVGISPVNKWITFRIPSQKADLCPIKKHTGD